MLRTVNGHSIGAALAAVVTLGMVAGAPAAPAARADLRPALGDWEGAGPHGLGLSFELVRVGGHEVARDLALGLPTSCRSTGDQTWDASAISRVEYVAPGTALHGPFPPLGQSQFELILPPAKNQRFPLTMPGTFSSPRRGVISILSSQLGCAHTAWPKTLHFALSATRRLPVTDGLWTGTVTGPAGATGTVKIRVIDGGRIESDFAAAYSCPPAIGASGNFEVGPLPTVGFLIEASGAIGAAKGTETFWSGHFGAHGPLTGTFVGSACGSPTLHPTFTARRTGS
ncbi:MAG: hypothetical protein ACRDNK_14495 [Solirubrobacteraceae bacterium]